MHNIEIASKSAGDAVRLTLQLVDDFGTIRTYSAQGNAPVTVAAIETAENRLAVLTEQLHDIRGTLGLPGARVITARREG